MMARGCGTALYTPGATALSRVVARDCGILHAEIGVCLGADLAAHGAARE